MAKKKETPKERRRRYSLHSKVRALGYTVHARRRQVDVPHARIESLEGHKIYEVIKRLMDLRYNIQTKI